MKGRTPKNPEDKRTTLNLSLTQHEMNFFNQLLSEGKNKSHFMLKAIHKTKEFQNYIEANNIKLQDINQGKQKAFFT